MRDEGAFDTYSLDRFVDEDSMQERPRRRKRRKSHPPKKKDDRYLTPRDISCMQIRGDFEGNAYQTLSTLLEPRVKASLEGNTLSFVLQDFGEVFASLDMSRDSACVYPDNCIGNRNAYDYIRILAEQGYACSVQKQANGNGERVIAACFPHDRSADIFLHKAEDETDADKLIGTFTDLGYKVRLWAGGARPLTEIEPDAKSVQVSYSKNVWKCVADKGVKLLKNLGYGVDMQSRPC